MRPLGSFRNQCAILRWTRDGRVLAIRYDRLGCKTLQRLFGRDTLIATWPHESGRGWNELAVWSAVRTGCAQAGELTEAKLNALGLHVMRKADRSWRVRARPFRLWELPAVQLAGEQGALIQGCLDAVQAMRSGAR